MTEPFPSTQTSSEQLAYKPISGWAIAGVTVGGLFTLMVVASTIIGLIQGAPVFFPLWILVLAILGIALSLLGQRQVQNSEGTRAGAKLARIGVWLSLVSGLTYSSYYFVTGLALQNQANSFLMEDKGEDSGFFAHLRKGSDDPVQLNTAFLLTQPPNSRTAAPDAEKRMREVYDIATKDGPGSLTQFREGMFGRIFFKHLGKDAEITPMAVLDWRYEQSSYKIYRTYRIKTKEIEMDVIIPVVSVEAEKAGEGRKWFVNLKEVSPSKDVKKLTPLGEAVRQLRQQASEWLTKEIGKLEEGAAVMDLKRVDKTQWDLLGNEDQKRSERRDLVYQAFAAGKQQMLYQFRIYTRADEPGKWEQDAGKIRIYLFFSYSIPRRPGEVAAYKLEGVAAIESKQVIDLTTFTDRSPAPDWNLVRMVFTNATSLSDRKESDAAPPR